MMVVAKFYKGNADFNNSGVLIYVCQSSIL